MCLSARTTVEMMSNVKDIWTLCFWLVSFILRIYWNYWCEDPPPPPAAFVWTWEETNFWLNIVSSLANAKCVLFPLKKQQMYKMSFPVSLPKFFFISIENAEHDGWQFKWICVQSGSKKTNLNALRMLKFLLLIRTFYCSQFKFNFQNNIFNVKTPSETNLIFNSAISEWKIHLVRCWKKPKNRKTRKTKRFIER